LFKFFISQPTPIWESNACHLIVSSEALFL